MTKFKSLKLRAYALMALVLLIGAGAAWKGIKAYQGDNVPKVVNEAGGVVNLYEASNPESQVIEDPVFGAVTSPDLPNPNCQNDECVWVLTGNFIDASTTIVSVMDPFQAVTGTTGGVVLQTLGGLNYTGLSTTVDMVRLYQTGAATSSYGVACGPNTTYFGAPVVTKTIVTTTAVNGTTQMVTSSLGILENNMTGAQGNRVNGGSVAKVMMGPNDPWFTCFVDMNADGPASITNGDNTFAGKYTIRFRRLRF